MKKLCIILLVMTIFCFVQGTETLTKTINFEQYVFDYETITGDDGMVYTRISTSELDYGSDFGNPELPIIHIKMLIPSNAEIDSINIKDIKQKELTDTYIIYPLQKPVELSADAETPAFVGPNTAIYNSDDVFPESIVKVEEDGYFDGSNHIVTLAISQIGRD